MRITNESELNTRIKAGPLGGLWLLAGNEEYLKKKYARLLLDKAVDKSARSFDALVLSGSSLNVASLAEDLEIFPAIAEYRSITITDFDADKLKDDWNTFIKLIDDIPNTTQLILQAAESADTKKSAKWKKLMALAADKGVCAELMTRSKSDLVKFIRSRLKPYNAEIDNDTAYKLIMLCNSDMTQLENETAKLGAYAAGGTITSKDLDAMIVVNLEASVFDMIKLLMRGDYSAAFQKLTILMEMNTEPIMIVAAMGSVYSDLYKAAVAIESGISFNEAVKVFGYTGMDFKLKNAWNEASKLSSQMVGASLQLICDADLKLKGSALPPELILVTLLTDLLRGKA